MTETAFIYVVSAGDVAIVSIVLFITFSVWTGVIVTVLRKEESYD